MAAAKEISLRAAVAAVLSELGDVFALKEETWKQYWRVFTVTCFRLTSGFGRSWVRHRSALAASEAAPTHS